ncbi:DNA-directed RNA polymerase III subunit 1-like isoform X2 [Ipomoea triloba]|uniref:DNA-directed RNA polymerase III subunit 1-like isoform X2 n=1 Tax=Ipomoea triloba TaxID=35885 RepID=UPI00125DCFAC|nr:DNA-directed RNA polymerase III subunit 1-like isoform X2 [Ipomoea triloba]
MMMRKSEAMLFTKQPYIEDVGPRKIKSIQFSTFSGSEVMKSAEVEVYRGVYYDASKNPIPNGLLDPRMGPPNKTKSCATCNGDFKQCPGHYGYLNLALPVFNVGYLPIIVDILKCICKGCSRILLGEKERLDFLRKMRNTKMEHLKKNELLKRVVKRCTAMTSGRKAVICSRCGCVNGMVKKGPLKIIHEYGSQFLDECHNAVSNKIKGSITVPPELDSKTVHALFKKMIDEDCELLYLSDKPEKLLVTSIPVPPIAIRPSVFVDGGMQSNENDITERLKRIIQANSSLRQEISDTTLPARSLASWVDLQMEVAQYINSDVRGLPPQMQASRPLSGFVQRLKGKQGRFRGNLSGKRVEYTGRTVISPDPNLKITEVAIPILMARILTFPERVSRHNIEKLRQCVRNGPNKYPGAKYIRHPDGTEISLMYSSRKRHADELKYGYIVDRHLEDGDAVLFNRQPSLHRMSIMCHRARIMPWRTLRFNESVCNPYNADFDGDEMNMHVPQTVEARTEALLLMGVQNNLCTPKSGEILVASTQDFLTSSFLITRMDTFYDRASFSLMCSYMGDAMDHIDLPTPALVKPVELWTGKQLFGVLLRPYSKMRVYLNLTLKEKSYPREKGLEKGLETMCPSDGFVYFRNSELISGQLGKATLGNGNKDGLYSVLLRDYNTHGAAICMNRLAKLSARWIGNHGFSIGIDDVQPGKELVEKKTMEIEKGYGICEAYIASFKKGELEDAPGCDAAQTLEANITKELNAIRVKTGQVCTDTLHWRNSPLIMSKCGSKGSDINISQMVACVGQQSVGGCRAPNGFMDRSLPHFATKSIFPAAKGFVASSFYDGLSATEFFFHTMGGREGLVDTAVKTADTGYMSRRLMKALEDLSILYDRTVRNASSCIVQFEYGDDGMDPAQMEEKEGHPLNFNRLFMKVKATCPPGEEKSLSSSEIQQMVHKRLSEHDTTPDGGCSAAFCNSLKEFIENNCVASLEKTRKDLKLDGEHNAGEDLDALESITLNISGVTRKQLQVFLETCISRYHAKKLEDGTSIGAIGAQSIGEPGTQMTLKTFHFAGVASMNVTLGVPRIKEIINAAKRISTPIIEAKLSCDDNQKFARIVKGRIEKTLLGQVAKSIKIVMAARVASIVIVLDLEAIQTSCLSIDAYIVKESILQTKKIKLKEQHIKVLDPGKLEVIPHADRSKLHFELHRLKNKLPGVVVKGINTVERAVINKDEKEKEMGKEKYNLLVEGTGLLAVMGTDGVVGCNTKTNHIMEVNQVLGIEAARQGIIGEIKYIMKQHGMTIDVRHMMLLADLMTFKGEVLGITRFGIQKMKDSVLTLASFEKTADHLFNASVSGRDDKIEGVGECIIMGIPMQMGTGMLKVMQSNTSHPVELNYGKDSIIPRDD